VIKTILPAFINANAIITAFITWLFVAFWDIHRGPRITFEGITINAPDDFSIKLANKGWREASECIVTLESAPLSASKKILNKYSKPTHTRMNYILENEKMSEVNIS